MIGDIVTGLADGAIYASLALALVLIYRTTGIVNFAQGEMATLATFVVWQLLQLGWTFPAALAGGIVAAAALGLLIEQALIRPVAKADQLTILIVTLGLFVAINATSGLIWSYVVKPFPSPFPDGGLHIAGSNISFHSLGSIGVLCLIVIFVAALLKWTRLGLAMRAVTSNPAAAARAGIGVHATFGVGWAIAAVVGTLAGVLAAPALFLEPNMMVGVLVYAFAAAALGGFDSPVGAVLAGLILGVLDVLTATHLALVGTSLRVAVPLAVIFVVLLVRPQGLFGQRTVTRV